MLEVKHLTKIYGKGSGKFKALDDVNIKFGDRGLVVILGKSGCGKSTLLNILGGLDQATDGEVVINGRSNKTFSKGDYDAYRNTYVGIIFQEFNLIDDITVFENIDMTLKLQEKTADVNTVDEVLGMVGLSNLGYRKPSELSGGQRQRVAIARALLKKPEIILADEPTGSLDSNTSEDVFESLKKIAETKLVVVVTHEKDLAAKYGERVLHLVDGKIVSDVTREEGSVRAVKELSENVIEVSAGGKVTEEMLETRIDPAAVNYIGISHDKDRIALAYPETVDTFYAKADSAKYLPTDEGQIADDNRQFQLSKGKLPLSEALKMARKNKKRSKKRYRLLTMFSVLCFAFLGVSIIIGMIDTPSLVAKSAFEANAPEVVSISKLELSPGGYYTRGAITERDYNQLNGMGIKHAKHADIVMAPTFAASVTENYNKPNYGVSRITGVLEGARPTELGIRLIPDGGTDELKSTDEVVISDLLAHQLVKSGYVGRDRTGELKILAPETPQEVIGTSFEISSDGKRMFFKVAGIFQTDAEQFRAALAASEFDTNAAGQAKEFILNQRFLYSKAFVKDGFTVDFNAKGGTSQRNLSFGIRSENYMTSFGSNGTYTYDAKLLGEADQNHGQESAARLLWPNGTPPESLDAGKVFVNIDVVRSMLDLYNVADPADIIKDPRFSQLVEQEFDLSVMSYSIGDSKNVLSKKVRIAGVFESYSGNISPFLLSEEDAAMVTQGISAFNTLYIPRGSGSGALGGQLKQLSAMGYIGGSAKADTNTLISMQDMFDMLGQIFIWASIVLLVFTFLIILNYTSASVRFRTKEIAVYRVVGAKAFDVAKIFLLEGVFIILRTVIFASILAWLTALLLNTSISSFMLGISIISFNFLHFLIIFGICTVFVFLASLLPILNITRKKPVDAVKMV